MQTLSTMTDHTYADVTINHKDIVKSLESMKTQSSDVVVSPDVLINKGA